MNWMQPGFPGHRDAVDHAKTKPGLANGTSPVLAVAVLAAETYLRVISRNWYSPTILRIAG